MKALIFAAGLGTRLKPYTESMPKALVPVDGEPLLKIVMQKLIAAGYDDIVINVHHFADQVIDYVTANSGFGARVSFSDERDLLRETGGGLRHAAELLKDSDGPFLIHNVDIISNLDLDWFRRQFRPGDLASILVSNRKTDRYFLFDEEGSLVGWENVATGEVRSPYPGIDLDSCRPLAFSGVHLVSPEVFPLLEEWPEKFSIVDFYLACCRTSTVRAAYSADLNLVDVGKPDALSAARDLIRD
ncbi:MAG: NTP transferase domain-containing protein [Bacteroidales bacterium]|nr:NTP transferase domain-containing protein [Candidatus Cacconaster merdequi]